MLSETGTLQSLGCVGGRAEYAEGSAHQLQSTTSGDSNRQLRGLPTDNFGDFQPTTSGGIESTVSPVVDDLFVCLCCRTRRLELTVRQGTVSEPPQRLLREAAGRVASEVLGEVEVA